MSSALTPTEPPDTPTTVERLFYPSSPESVGPAFAAVAGDSAVLGLRTGSPASGSALRRKAVLSAERVEGLRIVSVGNVNVGGTGKTPAVLHLAETLVRAGSKVGILTRGYGRRSKESLTFTGQEPLPSVEDAGDEPLLLARRCPQARVLVGADRRALARRARDEFGLEVVLLDDGFQHRRLATRRGHRGGGRSGGLRQRPAAAERPTPGAARPRCTEPRSSGYGAASSPVPHLPPLPGPKVRTRYQPTAWVDPAGTLHSPEALSGVPVLALAGLARPGGFLRTLRQLGVDLQGSALFPDHHPLHARRASRRRATRRTARSEGGDDGEGRGAPAAGLRGLDGALGCGGAGGRGPAPATCAGLGLTLRSASGRLERPGEAVGQRARHGCRTRPLVRSPRSPSFRRPSRAGGCCWSGISLPTTTSMARRTG